jgi:hypothetical protein
MNTAFHFGLHLNRLIAEVALNNNHSLTYLINKSIFRHIFWFLMNCAIVNAYIIFSDKSRRLNTAFHFGLHLNRFVSLNVLRLELYILHFWSLPFPSIKSSNKFMHLWGTYVQRMDVILAEKIISDEFSYSENV